jgi:hypothetical protein
MDNRRIYQLLQETKNNLVRNIYALRFLNHQKQYMLKTNASNEEIGPILLPNKCEEDTINLVKLGETNYNYKVMDSIGIYSYMV